MGGSIIQNQLPQTFDPNPSWLKQDKKAKTFVLLQENEKGRQ